MSETPLVAVIMGSKSDWETMRHADEMLTRLGVPHECAIVSAHRTPDWMAEYASAAEGRGLEVIIAGAGGAAHLPGMVAAHTHPARARRAGREPRAEGPRLAAVDRPDAGRRSRGDAGHRQGRRDQRGAPRSRHPVRDSGRAIRDGAARISRRADAQGSSGHAAVSDPDPARARRSACSAAGSSAACSPSPRAAWATASTRSSPDSDTPTGQVADVEVTASYDDLDAVRRFARERRAW